MKLDKLVKTLRRDVAANPAKASALGVLLLVGLYFWGPLVWKYVGGNKKAVAVVPGTAAVATSASNPISNQALSVDEKIECKLDWREVRQRREKDPLTRTADFQLPWKHAFFTPAVTDAPKSKGAEEQVKRAANVDPRQLGLVLEGVVIGSKNRRAIISGKVYRELDPVTIGQNTEANQQPGARPPELVFRLKQVSRKMVELERDGRIWRLEMGDPQRVTQPSAEKPQTENESPIEKSDALPVQSKAQ